MIHFVTFGIGGRIDHSHHDGVAFKALNDTLALADAVQMADDMTNDNDTLIVVTADHSHVFTFGGYATFEKSIFGRSIVVIANVKSTGTIVNVV